MRALSYPGIPSDTELSRNRLLVCCAPCNSLHIEHLQLRSSAGRGAETHPQHPDARLGEAARQQRLLLLRLYASEQRAAQEGLSEVHEAEEAASGNEVESVVLDIARAFEHPQRRVH